MTARAQRFGQTQKPKENADNIAENASASACGGIHVSFLMRNY